jgi:hypothetical protein
MFAHNALNNILLILQNEIQVNSPIIPLCYYDDRFDLVLPVNDEEDIAQESTTEMMIKDLVRHKHVSQCQHNNTTS